MSFKRQPIKLKRFYLKILNQHKSPSRIARAFLISTMDKKSRSLLSDLINMVMADGKINPSEVEFIQKLAKRMDISDREVIEIFENPEASQIAFSEVEKITHFYKLILVMNIDNETHESEIVPLKNFGLKMGIRPIVADQILRKMDAYENKFLPTEELLNIFKIYYN